MKPIAQNTYSFEKLRRMGAVYVDKTAQLAALIQDEASSLNFIARPRRFGKSLMLSTLRAIFEGRKDLFEGLAIEKTDYNWENHPVIHFDFSGVNTFTVESFETSFKEKLVSFLCEAGASVDETKSNGILFSSAITELKKKTGKGVVLLIDEYDAPIAHALEDKEKASYIRDVLANLYIQIKENEKNIRFMMMTGVSRFTKLSVFSSLNNITDLTFSERTASLLGYTREELNSFFSEYLQAHSEKMSLSFEDYHKKLQWWYDGYCFSERNAVKVYNPFAIARTLAEQAPYFEPTWTDSGRSSMLMNYLKREDVAMLDFEELRNVSKSDIEVCELDKLSAVGMLYQAGYLTIKDFNQNRLSYTLAVPNEEVRQDVAVLVARAAIKENGSSDRAIERLRGDLLDANFDNVKALLCSYFADLYYAPTESRVPEASYQRILYTLFKASGLKTSKECQQTSGRADLIVEDLEGVFIFELKVDKSADEALRQIDTKQYVLPYFSGEAPVYKVGLNFDSKSRQLTDFQVEKVK